jgi:hypothetical protein
MAIISISNLPKSPQLRIASYLSPYELDKLGTCSKALRNLCIDNSFWEPGNKKLDFLYSLTPVYLEPLRALASHRSFRDAFAVQAPASREIRVLDAFQDLSNTPLTQNTFFRDICLSDKAEGKAWACYRVFIMTLRKESLESRQKFVKIALAYQFQGIPFYLGQIGLLNNSSAILSDALFYEHWPLCLHLLQKAPPNLRVQFSGKALIEAARTGRLFVVKRLHAEITEEDYCTAVVEAAAATRCNIVGFLLKKPIPDACRGRALVAAATAGCLKSMNALVKSGSIPEMSHASAIRPAIISGCVDFVKLLLDKSMLTGADLGNFIILAVGSGYPKIVEYLLSKGSISMKDRGIAAVQAVHAGKIVHAWPNTLGVSEDLHTESRALFELAHAKFIGMHSIAILEMLFQSGPISREKHNEAARAATQANRPDIVEFLTKNAKIPQEHIP